MIIRCLLFFALVLTASFLHSQVPFITTWETTPTEMKIVIPIKSGLTYSYSVDWENDGTIDTFGVTGPIEYQYATAGIHQIAITGTFPGIYINDGTDKEKIVSIDQWGDIAWETMESAFKGANNLVYNATDIPDLSNVVQLTAMFSGATLIDADISYWDITTIQDMSSMLDGTSMSTVNYDKLLYRWSRLSVMNGVEIGVQGLAYCVSGESKETLEDDSGWNFVGDGRICAAPRPFVTTWRTTFPNDGITIKTDTAYTYNYQIDWDNDGTIDASNLSGDTSHIYPTAGQHQVAIYGQFPAIKNIFPVNLKLINIDQWGDIEWMSMEGAFEGCQSMSSDAYDMPDLSNVTSMSRMFFLCSHFSSDINGWDVSNITNMSETFRDSYNFNQDLNKWDVSNVTSMMGMFSQAYKFNGNIGNWNVSNVTDFRDMFRFAARFDQNIASWDIAGASGSNVNAMFSGAAKFNQDIGSWHIGNKTELENLFAGATTFNQDISMWETDSVTTMAGVFLGASSFNQAISTWDVSNVTSFNSMFEKAIIFNQDLSSWDVSSATTFASMFRDASSFNGDISNWDVDSVGIMSQMFDHANAFNGDISSWDVSSVEYFSCMFCYARSFNQDISRWNTESAKNMIAMFSFASSFNQDLGSWNIATVQTMIVMLDNSGLSQFNYDNTLIKWSSQLVYPGVPLGAAGLEYCYGSDARNSLNSNNNWIISGDVESCINAQPCASPQLNTYLGPTSGIWNTASNWSTGTVPDVCDDVVIPSGFIISLSDHAECYTLDISVGSIVTFEDYELVVWGL